MLFLAFGFLFLTFLLVFNEKIGTGFTSSVRNEDFHVSLYSKSLETQCKTVRVLITRDLSPLS